MERRKIERQLNPHSGYQERFSPEELAALEREVQYWREREEESAAAALARAQAMRAWDEAEHVRLRPLYVKLNGGYDHRDLSLDAE